MAATDMPEAAEPAKRPKKPLLIGAALALVLGGGAFYALYSGMILGGDTGGHAAEAGGAHGSEPGLLDVAFVPVDPLIITLGPDSHSRHLRFRAQLEVTPSHQEEVKMLMPRVLDVLNSYLRAVEVAELEDPAALITLRAQMLRRIQLVAGQDRVRDVLITEFVLN
jgi:flagellar FliL protein